MNKASESLAGSWVFALVSALMVSLPSCGSRPSDLAAMPGQDVYVWQRVWTPALVVAIGDLPVQGAIHVLAEQWQLDRPPVSVAPDFKALRASGRPIIPVIRLHGATVRPDQAARWQARLVGLIDRWRAEGLPVAAIEFDHDAPSARLAIWRETLRIWRAALPAGLPLRVTALPAWLDAPAGLRDLADTVDGFVVQVHAVEHPRHGLFDPDRAERWARRFSQAQPKPFQVSVPAYGSRVAMAADGEQIVDVRSEAPTLSGVDPHGIELVADPLAVQRFAQRMAIDAPPRFMGLAWFRLPLASDRRAWSPETWRAAVQGERLNARFIVEARPTDSVDVFNVWLINHGTLDATPPASIRAGASCTAADGAAAYQFQSRPQPRWLRSNSRPLRAGDALLVGWGRCSKLQESFDVVP